MDLSKAVALLRAGDVDAEAIFEVPKKPGENAENGRGESWKMRLFLGPPALKMG